MTKFVLASAAALTTAAGAQVRITEWMYNGGTEFIEITNLGPAAVDFTGWSFDDSSRTPGSQSLSGFGVVAAGESVILTEAPAADFRFFWSLAASVKVIGENSNNLGRGDEINVYDDSNALVDRLTYDDQNIGGPRTNAISGVPNDLSVLGTNTVTNWKLSVVGDEYNSYTSSLGDVANPGYFIPAPAGAALFGVAGLVAARRRRA